MTGELSANLYTLSANGLVWGEIYFIKISSNKLYEIKPGESMGSPTLADECIVGKRAYK